MLRELWATFRYLSANRVRGEVDGTPRPLSEQEIGWHFALRGVRPARWQMEALHLWDYAYRNPDAELFRDQEKG